MRLVDERDREMEAKGITTDHITHYKKRYFIHGRRSADSPIMTEFLFSELDGGNLPRHFGRYRLPLPRAVRRQGGRHRFQIRLAPGFRLRRPLPSRLSFYAGAPWTI